MKGATHATFINVRRHARPEFPSKTHASLARGYDERPRSYKRTVNGTIQPMLKDIQSSAPRRTSGLGTQYWSIRRRKSRENVVGCMSVDITDNHQAVTLTAPHAAAAHRAHAQKPAPSPSRQHMPSSVASHCIFYLIRCLAPASLSLTFVHLFIITTSGSR